MAAKKTIRWFNLVAVLRAANNGLSTAEIHERLNAATDVDPVDLRTIQRDLVELSESGYVALEREVFEGRDLWFLDRRFIGINADRVMTGTVALTLKMAIEHASILLPLEAQAFLLSQSNRIEETLSRAGAAGRIPWSDKVRVVPPGFQPEPPHVPPEVVNVVYRCLAADTRMRIGVRARASTGLDRLRVSPLGLVYRPPSLLLVGLVHTGSVVDTLIRRRDEVEAIHLERIAEIKALDDAATRPQNFDLDDYLWRGHLDGGEGRSIRVRLRCSRRLAIQWEQTPLGRDQLIEGPKDSPIVEATCADTEALVLHLLGLGTEAEVLAPYALRERLVFRSQELARHYAELFPNEGRGCSGGSQPWETPE